tara:strand:+ start:95 stop:673 length:579 start_codon:yes stop_codon:yes gene_type:complete
MKLIELILDDDDAIGVEAISVVKNPAIESDFITLSNEQVKLAEVNKEKRLLMGAILIPEKAIPRNGEGDELYHIFFSKDTVLKASQMYLQNGNQSNSTLEHKNKIKGITLVESWIVEDKEKDKTALYGIKVPLGTWMGSFKCDNDEVYNMAKEGIIKGFSIEGYFADKIENKSKSELSLKEKTINELKELLK